MAAARVLAGRGTLPSKAAMKVWEHDRILERGDDSSFWALMPDFERYFEDLRAIAGEPQQDTDGRVLPPYNPEWATAFWELIAERQSWWRQQVASADRAR